MVSYRIVLSAVGMTFVLIGLTSASSILIEMTKTSGQVDGGSIEESVKDQQQGDGVWMVSTDSLDVNFDCRCCGSHCTCCRTIRVPLYPSYCCVVVDHRHHLDSLEFSLRVGHRQLFDREISLRHHPPVCARLSFRSRVTLCLELNDVSVWGHRDRACAFVTVRSYYRRRVYRMGCFSVVYRDQEQEEGSMGSDDGAETRIELLPADWMEPGEAVPISGAGDLDEEEDEEEEEE